jgi:hypothetical protein
MFDLNLVQNDFIYSHGGSMYVVIQSIIFSTPDDFVMLLFMLMMPTSTSMFEIHTLVFALGKIYIFYIYILELITDFFTYSTKTSFPK